MASAIVAVTPRAAPAIRRSPNCRTLDIGPFLSERALTSDGLRRLAGLCTGRRGLGRGWRQWRQRRAEKVLSDRHCRRLAAALVNDAVQRDAFDLSAADRLAFLDTFGRLGRDVFDERDEQAIL